MHREVNGYWPTDFQQRKLFRDEGSILVKAFCKMIFATRHIEEVDEFLIKYYIMATNLNFSINDSEDFRKEFRVMIEGHFEHDLYRKLFNNQIEPEEETDTLQQRIKWWMMVVNRGGLIPNNVYGYSFDYFFGSYWKDIVLEIQEKAKAFGDLLKIP